MISGQARYKIKDYQKTHIVLEILPARNLKSLGFTVAEKNVQYNKNLCNFINLDLNTPALAIFDEKIRGEITRGAEISCRF
jgi:hypothetical protein